MSRTTTMSSLLSLMFVIGSSVGAVAASDEARAPAGAPGKVVYLKKEYPETPKYPAEFYTFWNDEGFVGAFEGAFESESGIRLNAAQKSYIRTVMLPEVRGLAYRSYLLHDPDLNVLVSLVEKHFIQNGQRYFAGIMQRADAQQWEQMAVGDSSPLIEESEEFAPAPAAAE
jgi:hypothetical protein